MAHTPCCDAQSVIRLLSGKWTLVLIWTLRNGPLRFSEVRGAARGISEKVLAQQLRRLEADGLVERTAYPEVPPRVEYALADRGRDLGPVLESLSAWAHAHLDAPAVEACPPA